MSFSWSPTRSVQCLPADLPMQQHPRYGLASQALGAKATQLSFGAQGTVQVLERNWPLLGRFALLSRGPIWQPETSSALRQEGLLNLIHDLRKRYRGVIVTPDLCNGLDPLRGSGLLQTLTPFHAAILDLRATHPERRAALHGKWRNQLVKAEAANITISHGPFPATPRHWLLEKEKRQSRTKRYSNLPAAFTVAWAAQGTDATRLFVAQQNGQLIAAMLFLLHAPSASYHIGWSGPAGRACCAHNLLLWTACNYLAETGHCTLDLGALDTVGAPGLARFKLGTGAQVQSTGSTWMHAPLSRAVAKLFPTKG